MLVDMGQFIDIHFCQPNNTNTMQHPIVLSEHKGMDTLSYPPNRNHF